MTLSKSSTTDIPAAETVKRRQQWSRNSLPVLLLSFTGMESFYLTLLGTERQWTESRCWLQVVGKRCYSTHTTATATNTGLKNGACTFIEQSLDQEMAGVACRHHIMELVVASIFWALFGPTGGPDVAMFKRSQTSWPYIDQSIYKTASGDMFNSCTAVLWAEMVSFCEVALEESQPREDYEELIHLCMIFYFLGWCRSCRSFLSSTRSISSGTMDGQSNLQSEVVLVPRSVHFD